MNTVADTGVDTGVDAGMTLAQRILELVNEFKVAEIIEYIKNLLAELFGKIQS